ncbi:MAG: 50S ribosomal protein L18 [Rhodospirillaceae bacterium]|jgi:large subunit ribosomal protein L18|nr:50S ribosomal protein L18 [Magnetovibrio sp.]MAY66237.1 50S ribosomal protein L18 [Rhodospirillaceae bacterium]
MANAREKFEKRQLRVRRQVRKAAGDRLRLAVFRSGLHIYAQVIDDRAGKTVAAASSLDKELKGKLAKGCNIAAAGEVGKLIATRAVKEGIKEVIFDRGGYKFHGRVKALADAAREAGLSF